MYFTIGQNNPRPIEITAVSDGLLRICYQPEGSELSSNPYWSRQKAALILEVVIFCS